MRKTIAILLALMMVLSLAGMAFAQPPERLDVPGPKHSLVALGDSITAGYGLERNLNRVSRKAYPQLLGDEINCRVTNLAVVGMTSCEVLEAVQNNNRYRNAIARADMIILNIGGADMLGFLEQYFGGLEPCPDDFIGDLGSNISSILTELRSINTQAPVLLYNIYEPYPVTVMLEEREDFEAIGGLLTFLGGVNYMISQFASPTAGIFSVDAYAAFDNEPGEKYYKALMLFVDEVHPSEEGQELLFNAAYKVLAEEDLLYSRPMPPGLAIKACDGAVSFGLKFYSGLQ